MRALLAALTAAVLAAGCTAQPAPQETSPTPTSTASGISEPTITLPPTGGFDYQLGGAYEPPPGTAIVARDSTALPAPGLYNICYINGFQSQPGQADAWAGLILEDADGPVADPEWPDEFLLDTSTASNRAAIADKLGTFVHSCATKGFDAVEFDNLDSFTRSGGALTAADNLALAALYIADAHAAGLATAQKNSAELVTQGAAAGFDFAVTEECGQYRECDVYQAVYAIVLDIEYGSAEDYASLCAAGALPPQSVRRDIDLVTPALADYVFERCP